MSHTLDAFLRSWPFDPWLWCALLVMAGVYLRGWLALHRRDARRWHLGPLLAFFGGLAAVFAALGSPIEVFAQVLLQVHMIQHMLLMMLAPPLLWLGEPLSPLLLGLSRPLRMGWFVPLLRSPFLRQCFLRATHPFFALPVFVLTTWLWHIPAAYEAALSQQGWHYLQHACFLGSSLLFWYPIVRPFPSRPRWPIWWLIPYLLLADLQNTVLSALLTFSDQVLYATYTVGPHMVRVSPLDDQAAAGVIMWIPGSLAFLLPLFAIALRLMSGNTRPARHRRLAMTHLAKGRTTRQDLLPVLHSSGSFAKCSSRRAQARFDVLQVPILGRFLRWRHARVALQGPTLLLAAAIIYDGFRGPEVSAMNLAGVLPWIHWRGLVVMALLIAGNLFCMACPFTLPRALAHRFLPRRAIWPRWLRSKWLAVALVAGYFWAYEAFSLWDSPWWTAWIGVGYFFAAFLVDGLFQGASFCKYVCPIGQFNFVQSLVSPLEVRVRHAEICSTCRTHDCIQGNDKAPGCELELFQPRKLGNMDCTFCLDCVHACPHENIGILARMPGKDLWQERAPLCVSTLTSRPDVAALAVVFVFAAFANAAGMVAPVLRWQEQLQTWFRLESPLLIVSLFYASALIVLPGLIIGVAALLSRRFGNLTVGWVHVATRFSFALIPVGFGMWLAHYSFHLLTSWESAFPTIQRFATSCGVTIWGTPQWSACNCQPAADWLLRMEILFLDFGMLLSLYAGYRISRLYLPRAGTIRGVLAPWAVLILLLFLAGLWIVFQPMEMRGTMMGMG